MQVELQEDIVFRFGKNCHYIHRSHQELLQENYVLRSGGSEEECWRQISKEAR